MPMLEQNNRTEQGDPLPHAAFEQQQRRRMFIALMVLLLALVSVLIKDHQFWFPSSPGAESEIPDQSVTQASPPAVAIKTPLPLAPPKPAGPAPAHVRPKSKRSTAAARSTSTPDATPPFIVATNRAVLPPLQVEVVAGNQHRAISPGDSSVKLDMQPSDEAVSEQSTASAQTQDSAPATTRTRAQVELSPGSAQVISRVDPSYPLLAKQMKVQGAVVLEALISKSGSIQDIQVLSGPAILSEAAREAVKQWHFKPYYQGGQPVETEARVTVNFTISTY
ncbi:MAG TPA: energy transducer TonB [Terriglobales bacterium]|nr:energy transducer TonB [Terriglobales bacterium]